VRSRLTELTGPRYQVILVAAILVLLTATRLVRLPGLEMDFDEIWSVWQTFGSPLQIIRWTPYDWPPLSYLLIGLWRGLVGIHPFVVRLLSVYVFLLGAAMLYRVTVKLFGQRAALLTLLAFGGLGFVAYLSVLLRGYIVLTSLMPWALWLTLRYFNRPTVRRAVPLGICMAIMFYIHLSAVVGYAMLGLYTLFMYRRRFLRWWLPGLIAAVLAAPETLSKLVWVPLHVVGSGEHTYGPIFTALGYFYSDTFGYLAPLWIALVAVAAVLIIRRCGFGRQVAVLVVWMLAPIVMYLIAPVMNFFTPRHLWWVPMGIAMWVGWGFSLLHATRSLPRAGYAAVSALLVVGVVWPVPESYAMYSAGWLTSFKWLSEHQQAGDVLVIDPRVNLPPEVLDYYTQVFFPEGLKVVKDPAGYRRVWYLALGGAQTPALFEAVKQDRLAGPFVGPWDALFRLYEGPPNPQGILFANGLRFHGIDIESNEPPSVTVRRRGETVKMRLWWSVDKPVARDYSIGVYILGADGRLLTSADGAPKVPADVPWETSRWLPGRYYIDEREITLPSDGSIVTGAYPLYMAVYQPIDNVRVDAPGVDQNKLLVIDTVFVKAW
jgi:hypothetical protein